MAATPSANTIESLSKMAQLIQIRGDTAANWLEANPTLAERELAIETDSKLYKLGDGLTAWVDLPYAVLTPIADVLAMGDRSEHPPKPGSGLLKIYAKSIANRMLPRIIGPAGVSTPLQPSLFQNSIAMISPSRATALAILGTGVSSVGTISHPTANETFGFMSNFLSAATIGATAGTSFDVAQYFRGTLPGGSNGFFFAARLGFPDASYDATEVVGSGTRIVCGLTATTMSTAPNVDEVPNNSILFQRAHTEAGRKDVNWQIAAKDATAGASVVDTGLPFIAGKVYDFWLFCPPLSNVVYWRIDNVSDDLSVEGQLDQNESGQKLPVASVAMRCGFQLKTEDAIARNIRMQRLYCEADR